MTELLDDSKGVVGQADGCTPVKSVLLRSPMCGTLPIVIPPGVFHEHRDTASAIVKAQRLATTIRPEAMCVIYIAVFSARPRTRTRIQVIDTDLVPDWKPVKYRRGPIVLRICNHELQEYSDGVHAASEAARQIASTTMREWVVYAPALTVSPQDGTIIYRTFRDDGSDTDDLPF